MKALLVAVVALLGSVFAVPLMAIASADPGSGVAVPAAPTYKPPYIDHVQWTQYGRLTSLRVYPSYSGRLASRQPGAAGAPADEAWSEVLAMAPNADTPGMRAQFDCHWQLAELAQPGKSSWNLEPWRPVVSDSEMVASGCNPGGPEESFS
jgi:hypothetical protein